MMKDAAQRRSWTFYEAVRSLVKKFVLFVAKYFAKQIYKDVWALRFIVHCSGLPIERLQKNIAFLIVLKYILAFNNLNILKYRYLVNL